MARLSNELVAMLARARRAPADGRATRARARLDQWEDLLGFVADPAGEAVRDPGRAGRLVAHLLRRAGVDEEGFWALPRATRGQRFLALYARASRSLPHLEMTSFDVDKLLKERYRREPLTVGAAWHYGYWRSYFSHAAITHPANDGLREEFSTTWDIVRKRPAVLLREPGGRRLEELRALRLDMPIVVGPLPLHEGVTLELAYLQASADADEAHDVKTRTLVVVEASRARLHAAELLPFAAGLMVRVAPADAAALGDDGLRELVAAAPIVELDPWGGDGGGEGGEPSRLAALAAAVRAANPDCLLSVFVRHDGDAFWARLEEAARHDGVALVHYHAGALKSYRLTPAVDRFLKDRLLRARVQLLAAGGDGDTQASAATVYESVLLGSNGGAMTHAAAIALVPEAVDAFAAAGRATASVDALAGGTAARDDGRAQVTAEALAGSGTAARDALSSARDAFAAAVRAVPPADLREMARCTLTCWQHSILDFLSCMGIDDVKKTSGNTMAITVTEDWVREVDALATGEFGAENARVNAARVEAEPVPPDVRASYAVSSLLGERSPDLPLVRAAQVLAQRTAGLHLSNSNAALNADFLDVIYRMAAGELPREDDFFLQGDPGRYGLDRIGLRVSRASVAWSLARLRRDPSLLDYVSLAVPRGFERPGAAAPAATVSIHAAPDARPLLRFDADERGGFEQRVGDDHPLAAVLAAADLNGSAAAERTGSAAPGAADSGAAPLWLRASEPDGGGRLIELKAVGHGAHGACVVRASADGAVTLRRDPRGGLVLSGVGIREPIWHGPVCHASTSLGAASEDFLTARVEGNVGLSMTSSGEGGPIKLARDGDMRWESLQVASGHFGVTGRDLRRVRDVEIKINQGAKPGKGGRLSGAKVTPTVSKARNIPVGTDALSPDPKHDIYSIEDMPAEVWLWLLYHNHCGIKITGSNYTRYVAAGMWSNFVVDYLLVDAGMGGSGNYHADSSHVGWPDAFRTMLHTHHALLGEKVDLDGSGELKPLRDGNGAPFGAKGGTRLFASGGLRGELDMLKVLIAGADGLLEGSIGKAVAFGCNQCGNCHLDCPRGGITTKPELMVQNDRELMRRRFRNWTVLNMVKLAVLVDALNRESGALAEDGSVADEDALLDDIRKLRGRTDLLEMPQWPAAEGDLVPPSADAVTGPAAYTAGPSAPVPPAAEHDSCRVGSLTVSEPVDIAAIWEAARLSSNGGNNRGGGLAWAGFAPAPVRGRCCLVVNTLGHDRAETLRAMLEHLGGCGLYGADGAELAAAEVADRLDDFRLPVRERYAGPEGWRLADLREDPGDFHLFFVEPRPDVLARYGRTLLAGDRWLQRRTKYGELGDDELAGALAGLEAGDPPAGAAADGRGDTGARLSAFLADVREEYLSVLGHLIDSRYYRTHTEPGAPEGKYAAKRRGYLVSMGEDLAAVKISGWTHTIPEYLDFTRLWEGYPGVPEDGLEIATCGREVRTHALFAHVWALHHRYPTNSPAIDAEGRGNPAGAHPFKAYDLLLMHNGEQVGVDSTSPFLREFGYVHVDPSMGPGWEDYAGDSLYDRKALTDTEYAAYLVDFTRRVLGLTTEEASQVISPITGLDLAAMPEERRRLFELLSLNYVQLTPTGPYKFTIVESRPGGGAGGGGEAAGPAADAATAAGAAAPRAEAPAAAASAPRRVGFRENMDIKFLRPHELVVSVDTGEGGVEVVANGSEAKIADAMLRALHHQGVLKDAAHDLRFNMRPGGTPGRGEFGGVVEAFLTPGDGRLSLVNRFGEPVVVRRAGEKEDVGRRPTLRRVRRAWRSEVEAALDELAAALPGAPAGAEGRFLGPDDALPEPAARLVDTTLARLKDLRVDEYRHLCEVALPGFAARGDAERAAALRVLTELRKRVVYADLGGRALSTIEYVTDGGRAADGSPEGGVYRLLDAVPPLTQVLAEQAAAGADGAHAAADPTDAAAGPTDAAADPTDAAAGPTAEPPVTDARSGGETQRPAGRWARLTLESRDDLLPPTDAARDVLVVDFDGFASEAFGLDCAARFLGEAVRQGWRHFVGYGCLGGPRYVGANLADAEGASAEGVVLELYGRETGDFLGALLEGAELWLYGQGQCHVGMKADSGYLFVLQDALNTCFYAAHGGTLDLWDSGSRFAVAGQNKVTLDDGVSPAQGLRSIHFGSPNEYAFEYLMSGGDNSLHVVMGLEKPDEHGELRLRAKPYFGKFFMSGAAAGRVFVFDPERRLDPAQYHGNVVEEIEPEVWVDQLAPFIALEAARRGAPLCVEGDEIVLRLEGEWRRFRFDEAFIQLVPQKVARSLAKKGVTPPQLTQLVDEL